MPRSVWGDVFFHNTVASASATLHPELVAMLWSWLEGLADDQVLFPKLAKRRTWLMVKKDLERINIPYLTADGVADFHAAGRHTHITELLRNGASLPGRLGRQPNASYRSVRNGPLPLVADFVKKLTILDICSTEAKELAIPQTKMVRHNDMTATRFLEESEEWRRNRCIAIKE